MAQPPSATAGTGQPEDQRPAPRDLAKAVRRASHGVGSEHDRSPMMGIAAAVRSTEHQRTAAALFPGLSSAGREGIPAGSGRRKTGKRQGAPVRMRMVCMSSYWPATWLK